MLNARWLETFTALCEIGHFTRAADLLGMTQPGVSQHLRKLEDQIGQKLITQQGKSFILTPAGEAVLTVGHARRAEERRLREAIETDDPNVGAVTIACSGSFAMLLYPYILPLMQGAPNLIIHLEATPQTGVSDGVLKGVFDLGIVGRDPSHPRLGAEHLGQEELCLVLPADAKPGPILFADLQARGFVAHPDGFAYADALFSLNFPDEFTGSDRLRIRSYVNQIGQIPAPVAQGIGYTLLPLSGVAAYPESDRLTIVPLPRRRRHDLWLIFRRGGHLPARTKRIAQMIRTVAGKIHPS
jgi:DNA-binding transcriptional LysR family regulator